MHELTTSDHWRELQSKLKTKFPELTETDLEYQAPLQHDMLRMVGYKLGKTKKEMKEIIKSL